ncbi:hypothetical protein GIB67_010985 [Kingdonia uniflora]|uniref:Uncharacterized protein n=1 Tax=Kingdonia uniflora TaxID=39325 RepID=A0A7J7MMH1_9MAGN|nr:hypothetical protein GIB67_010985 [Kingdonia uniflora]
MASFAISEEGDGTQNLNNHEEQPLSDNDATLRNSKRKKTKGEPKGRLKGGQNKHGEISPDETLALGTTNTYQTSRNDQNNQQGEISIHENLVLGGTSNTHQPTKVLGNATGFISSKLGESQSSQVLANATGSIRLMLSKSQSSQAPIAYSF